MRWIERHSSHFVDRDGFLHLVLGVQSYSRKLDALLEAQVERADAADPAEPDARPPEAILHATLGVIALRRRFGRAVAAALRVASPVAVRPPARSRVLRELGR